jgi:hypothetical protein
MSMSTPDYIRAAVSGGVLAGVAYWMSGGSQPSAQLLTVAGVQAVSSLFSDRAHAMLMVYPSTLTGALGTGGAYAGIRYLWKGEMDYVANGGYSAAADLAARYAEDMALASVNTSQKASQMDSEEDNWDDW